jgi:hypothetical protein
LKNNVKLTTLEMQAITNVGLVFEGVEYDDTTYPTAFDWATRETEGVVICKLGSVLTSPARDTKAEIIIYTATDTVGVIWSTIDIQVLAALPS